MAPQAPWSPTAHAFAHHQFSHVANFWKQGREASFRLEALPGGRAELNLTFQLPRSSEVIPPPSQVSSPSESIPPPIHPAQFPPPRHCSPKGPYFRKSHFPQGHGSSLNQSVPKPASSPKVPSRQRKSYHRAVLHRAGQAASSLPPPKIGSLRQAASACVRNLQAEKAESERKRPLPNSPSVQTPLAQRIREDLQLSENEVDSPEKESLRSQTFPGASPLLSPPYVKGFPQPAPLVFTPSKIEAEEEANSVENIEIAKVEKVIEVAESVENIEVEKVLMTTKEEPTVPQRDPILEPAIEKCEESDWETIEDCEDNCENDFPAIDISCDNWDEKFNESVKRFHNIVNCENCDGVFTPDHQC